MWTVPLTEETDDELVRGASVRLRYKLTTQTVEWRRRNQITHVTPHPMRQNALRRTLPPQEPRPRHPRRLETLHHLPPRIRIKHDARQPRDSPDPSHPAQVRRDDLPRRVLLRSQHPP